MLKKSFPYVTLLLLLVTGGIALAQEEGSAELFTEAYTDAFQETFFQALKEKGIENYDRAQALLLECKQLDPLEPALDHELAKVLAAQKNYPAAESYAIAAVRAEPEVYWFAHGLMEILVAQYKAPEDLSDLLPLSVPEFRMNLARWYIRREEGSKALAQLEGLPETDEVVQLRQQAHNKEAAAAQPAPDAQALTGGDTEGSLSYFQNHLEGLLVSGNWQDAVEMASEAVEAYPLQPFFYFAKGRAQLSLGKASEAVTTLGLGEDLLLESNELALRIYQALAEAHTILGNTEKANSYRDKIKNGS